MLILMRGWPGSGKSTLAREIAAGRADSVVLSTDDFWVKDNEYMYDPTRIAEAHQWNQERVWKAVCRFLKVKTTTSRRQHPHIIVDNTNITLKQCQPYIDIAKDYDIVVRQCMPPIVGHAVGEWSEESWRLDALRVCLAHWQRCTHQMPFHIVVKMMEEFEMIPQDILLRL